MKTTGALLVAAGLALSPAPANAVVLDLSTMTCKQLIEGGEDTIKMVLTWMDGWYKGDSDKAIIDTDVFVANAKKFGTYCGKNPTISIVNAAEEILGKQFLPPHQVRGRFSFENAMSASRTRSRPSPPACCRRRWTG